MSDKTGISWTDATWNPVSGCTRVSAGCDNCYAVEMTKRLDKMGKEKYSGLVNVGKQHFNGVVKCHEDALTIPLGWKKSRRIFVNSMSDLFHKEVPFEFIAKVFGVMADCPQHTFQVLTKRPDRMSAVLDELVSSRGRLCRWLRKNIEGDLCCVESQQMPLPNVWLGTSVEDQASADERIPHLLKCPAAVRFLSVEPLLGATDLSNRVPGGIHAGPEIYVPAIHWVIVGGESGPNHRPMDMAHFESVCSQAIAAGVPLFVKQDSGARSGQQGRISDELWAYKQFPKEQGQ